ncbi:MAG TPA: hypothetical protein VK981_00290 [Ramlibacter sp.]|nr:hypothetical protein [Ramlibacter sp.]
MPAPLLYLDFDFSDEEDGRGSFDAMASVTPDRLPALQAEIDAVLAWATAAFGPGAADDEGEWGHDVQSVDEPGSRTTVTLTISGSPAFCDAFRHKFRLDDIY